MTASKVEKLRQKHDYLMGYDPYWDYRHKQWWNEYGKYSYQAMYEKGKIAQGTEPRLRRRRAWIDKIKLRVGCIDCGYREHAVALHFDHRDRTLKNKNISQMIGGKLNKIFEEIRKCDVRCANCHASKTLRDQETTPLIPRIGWQILEEDKIRLIKAYGMWIEGYSTREIAEKTTLSSHKVSQIVSQWRIQKAKERILAIEDPEGLHRWDSYTVTGNRLMRRATNKEYFIRRYGEAAL